MDQTCPIKSYPPWLLSKNFVRHIVLWRSKKINYSSLESMLKLPIKVAFLHKLASKYFSADIPWLEKYLIQNNPIGYIELFISLIAEYDLFPVNEPIIESFDDSIFYEIPICPLGIDTVDVEPINYHSAILLILSLFEDTRLVEEGFYKDILSDQGVQIEVSSGACLGLDPKNWYRNRELKSHWRDLPLLVQRALNCTGNSFLDYTTEEYYSGSEYPGWNEFEDCIHNWNEGKIIHHKVNSLLDWIEKDKPNRLIELKNILEGARNVS